MDYATEQILALIKQAKRIYSIYSKLKEYELNNLNTKYEKTLNELKYEIEIEHELYEKMDPEERTFIAEYLNNYKYTSEEANNFFDVLLDAPINDLVVQRIKLRIANSILSEEVETSDDLLASYDADDESKRIFDNCNKNASESNEQANEFNNYNICSIILDEYTRNYYTMICKEIEKTKILKAKEKLIDYKYDLLFTDNLIEDKILTSKSPLLDYISLGSDFAIGDNKNLETIFNDKRNDVFDNIMEYDISKMISLSNEDKTNPLFLAKSRIIYSSIRANIEIINNKDIDLLLRCYAEEIAQNVNITEKQFLLKMLTVMKVNYNMDHNNINSIRDKGAIRKLKK